MATVTPDLNLPNLATKKIGLVAGWGHFPVYIARTLIAQGYEVHCTAIKDHADPVLKEICTSYRIFGMARMGAQCRFFRKAGVVHATMAGKIFKTRLFQKKSRLITHFPDLVFWRHFYPIIISKSKDRRDDTLLSTVVELYKSEGITFAPATDFAPELLVKAGPLTNNQPNNDPHRKPNAINNTADNNE